MACDGDGAGGVLRGLAPVEADGDGGLLYLQAVDRDEAIGMRGGGAQMHIAAYIILSSSVLPTNGAMSRSRVRVMGRRAGSASSLRSLRMPVISLVTRGSVMPAVLIPASSWWCSRAERYKLAVVAWMFRSRARLRPGTAAVCS